MCKKKKKKSIVGFALAGLEWMEEGCVDDPGTSHKGGALYSGAGKHQLTPPSSHSHNTAIHATLKRTILFRWKGQKKRACTGNTKIGLQLSRMRSLSTEGESRIWSWCNLGVDINSHPAKFDYTFQMTLLASCRILHALCCQRAMAHHALLPWTPALWSQCAVSPSA